MVSLPDLSKFSKTWDCVTNDIQFLLRGIILKGDGMDTTGMDRASPLTV
jgi:hypothetical protein